MSEFYKLNQQALRKNFQKQLAEMGALGSVADTQSLETMFSNFVQGEEAAALNSSTPYTLSPQSMAVDLRFNTSNNAITSPQYGGNQGSMLANSSRATLNPAGAFAPRPGTLGHSLMMRRMNGGEEAAPEEDQRPKNSIAASSLAYGEVGEFSWRRRDYGPPNNLADAVASIAAACSRNKVIGGPCESKNVSGSTDPLISAAWNNIRNAVGGTDRTGGGNLMCVKNQQCVQVHSAYTYKNGKKVLVPRPQPLKPSGTVEITGSGSGNVTLYFYKMPYQGWLKQRDLQGPHK